MRLIHLPQESCDDQERRFSYALFTNMSRNPLVMSFRVRFKSTTDFSTVMSNGKWRMPASSRCSVGSWGRVVAIGWISCCRYSLTSASPIPPWPQLPKSESQPAISSREVKPRERERGGLRRDLYPVTKAKRFLSAISETSNKINSSNVVWMTRAAQCSAIYQESGGKLETTPHEQLQKFTHGLERLIEYRAI